MTKEEKLEEKGYVLNSSKMYEHPSEWKGVSSLIRIREDGYAEFKGIQINNVRIVKYSKGIKFMFKAINDEFNYAHKVKRYVNAKEDVIKSE